MYTKKLIQPTGKLFGRTLKNIKITDFELSEGSYTSRIKTPKHSHNYALLCLVLKGNYLETNESRQFERPTSTVFFHPPEEPHISDFSKTNVEIFQIEINPNRLWKMDCIANTFKEPMNFQGGSEFMLARKIYREFKLMDEVSPIAIEGLILELLALIARSTFGRKNHYQIPEWLKKTREILHDNFTENYSLDNLAAEIGVHPKYLATEFRRRYHLTIGEYIRNLRVERACRELEKPNASLVEIAISSGFDSQSHFTRTFKQLTGFTPSQYRKNMR